MDQSTPAGQDALYAYLEAEGIPYAHHEHPPLFTVADSQALRGELPGLHIKNMFLKEKKGGLWLVSCREDREIRIRDLEREIGAKNCSFGKPELLEEALGVKPGAVTPFAALNDREGRVQVVLDQAIAEAEIVNAHPLHNEATTGIAAADLVRFLEVTGHPPRLVDFDRLEAMARERAGT